MRTNVENEAYEEMTTEESAAVAIVSCGCVIVIFAFLAIVVLISLFCC